MRTHYSKPKFEGTRGFFFHWDLRSQEGRKFVRRLMHKFNRRFAKKQIEQELKDV